MELFLERVQLCFFQRLMCLKEKFAGFMGDQFVSNIVFILKI